MNFTGRGRRGRRGEGRKSHEYFREMGMLRLRTMSGGFPAQPKGSSQFTFIMVKVCPFLAAEGVEDTIFLPQIKTTCEDPFSPAFYYCCIKLELRFPFS